MLKQQYKEFFKTLGNEQRIEILLCLTQGEKSVSEIVQSLNAQQSTVSHNLKRLERCKFIILRSDGKKRIYSLNKQTIRPLFNIINKHANKYCSKLCCH